MHTRNTLALMITAITLTPFTVPASALADSCNLKVIKTSYQRISPHTVKEIKTYQKTRLISKAAPTKHFVHRTAYLAPSRHTTTTTTRTTSMFIPTEYVAPVAVVKPVMVAPVAVVKPVMVTPATTVVRTTALAPTRTTVIRTQSVVAPTTQILSSTPIIAAPGETVVLKEKHGKLKQVGTLKPVDWY